MKYKLVLIEWDDAYSGQEWHDEDELIEIFLEGEKYQVVNVGWLIKQNKRCVVLASRLAPEEEQFGLIQTLPKKMIKKITYLNARTTLQKRKR